jgi:hypothetical protein
MLFFPQLDSLAIAQFPLQERRHARTVMVRTAGGAVWRRADTDASDVVWRLTLNSLSDSERSRIDGLFMACAGALRPFTFIDPLDNLLRYSEDFSGTSWFREGGIVVTGGQSDPWGTARASTITNPSIQEQRLLQTVPIPNGYRYHLSVYARAATPSMLGLSIGSGADRLRQDFAISAGWSRYSLAGSPGGTQTQVEAAVHIASGATVEMVAMQLEAQVGASGYRKTAERCGVHPEARFLDDRLTWVTHGVNVHSTVLQIVGY